MGLSFSAFEAALRHIEKHKVPGVILEIGLADPMGRGEEGGRTWQHEQVLLVGEPIPGQIAVLRLMGDWYKPKLYELKRCWPHLSFNGVLVIDCYGNMLGARKATDEFFDSIGLQFEGVEIDHCAVMMVKPC